MGASCLKFCLWINLPARWLLKLRRRQGGSTTCYATPGLPNTATAAWENLVQPESPDEPHHGMESVNLIGPSGIQSALKFSFWPLPLTMSLEDPIHEKLSYK